MFDPNCQDLAEHFLSGESNLSHAHEARVKGLSQAIQDAVEAWFEIHPPTDAVARGVTNQREPSTRV